MRPDIQGPDALKNFLLRDRILADEIKLAEEVFEAMYEKDIILLRNQLKKTAKQTAKTSMNEHLTDAEAYFGLPEEISKPVSLEVDDQQQEIGNYLQQLHLKNHSVAAKEVVHDLFTEAEEKVKPDNLMLSPEDELLFEELKDAVTEKEIIDLRANIRSIAQSVPAYACTFEEIEDLVSGELDVEDANRINAEAMLNAALAKEIILQGEIRCAMEESDIMKLRDDLNVMIHNEFSHSRSVDEIDSYLNDEMDDHSRSLFEGELLSNSGLAAEVEFHREVQQAVGESGVMNLRGGLHNISQESAGNSLRIFGLASPKSKILYWSAAASIVVLFAISALLQPKGMTEQELYANYFQPYQAGDNVSRSVSAASANVMSAALREMDKGDYATALKMLKIASADNQDGYTACFYSGEAYQAIGDYKNAINSYTEVVRHGDNLLVEQSEWSIGLCYLGMNEKTRAVSQFRLIASRHGYYSKKSRDLLKRLR